MAGYQGASQLFLHRLAAAVGWINHCSPNKISVNVEYQHQVNADVFPAECVQILFGIIAPLSLKEFVGVIPIGIFPIEDLERPQVGFQRPIDPHQVSFRPFMFEVFKRREDRQLENGVTPDE